MGIVQTVTVLPGDGVGSEIVHAARRLIDAAGAGTDTQIHWEVCEAGGAVFKQGIRSGVPQDTLESIERNQVVLKGPFLSPTGVDETNANVTLRRIFGVYGSVRPFRKFPSVPTLHQDQDIDMVVVRENTEDMYVGVESMKTPHVAQATKLVSRQGCEKIVRLAFEFASSEGRSRVHCATKAHIMKFSEGMLKHTFEEIAADYPHIDAVNISMDDCVYQLVKDPTQFDVIVATNMNGAILSGLGASLVGGWGVAPMANIGRHIALFGVVHGTVPRYVERGQINPVAMMLGGVMLLHRLEAFNTAQCVENALAVTLQERCWTQDLEGADVSVGTEAFTNRVIDNLGREPTAWKARTRHPLRVHHTAHTPTRLRAQHREIVGVDIWIESTDTAEKLGQCMTQLCAHSPFLLRQIINRGMTAYPVTQGPLLDVVDLWCCRFFLRNRDGGVAEKEMLSLLHQISEHYIWMHMEKLYSVNGVPCFTSAQGG